MYQKTVERILWAIVLISIGGLMLAANLNLIDYNVGGIIIRLWPLFIIIPGISFFFKGQIFWGSVLSVIGTSFILGNFTNIQVGRYIWPLFIIAIGISLLFRTKKFDPEIIESESTENTISETVIFGGIEKRLKTDKFLGGKIDSIFGGSNIDLSEVKLGKDHVKLEVNAIFGGSEIRVNPENYRISSSGTGVFGAWENKSSSSKKDKPVLEITGAAIFGGVEIKS